MTRALLTIAFALVCMSASAQVLQPAAPREHVIDGRIYARTTDADSVVLFDIPARSAITRVFVMPEDTLWMLSASVVIATEYGEILTWTSETAGLDGCLGCFASDWPQTYGDVLYRAGTQRLVARLPGWTGDARGTMRIIVTYTELF